MAKQLTADDARQSLTAHVESKGVEIFMNYGPQLDWAALQRLLEDRVHVRYPCEIAFEAADLLAGEFAHPVPKGENPEDGFTMCVHPFFETQLDVVPALVLYQLVELNYGEFASADDAETFGAAALGMTRDEYYNLLCDCADQLGGGPGDERAMEDSPCGHAHAHAHVHAHDHGGGGCGGGGCSCGGR